MNVETNPLLENQAALAKLMRSVGGREVTLHFNQPITVLVRPSSHVQETVIGTGETLDLVLRAARQSLAL